MLHHTATTTIAITRNNTIATTKINNIAVSYDGRICVNTAVFDRIISCMRLRISVTADTNADHCDYDEK